MNSVTVRDSSMFEAGDVVEITTGSWPRWAYIRLRPKRPWPMPRVKRIAPMWLLLSIQRIAKRFGKKFGPQTTIARIESVEHQSLTIER